MGNVLYCIQDNNKYFDYIHNHGYHFNVNIRLEVNEKQNFIYYIYHTYGIISSVDSLCAFFDMPAILIIRNNRHYKNLCKLLLHYYNYEKKNSDNKYITDIVISYEINRKMYVCVSFFCDTNVHYDIHDESIIREYGLLSLFIKNELYKVLQKNI